VRRWLSLLLSLPVRRPRLTLVVAGALTLAAIVGASGLKVSTDLEAMFSRNDAGASALAAIMNRFHTADDLLVLVTLPADSPQPDPKRLIEYARRFEVAAAAAPIDGVIYRAPSDGEEFIEHEMGPAAMLYLNDAELASARSRLSPAGMRGQLARDEAMLSQPGPAAGALAKAMMQDPLFLHDFFVPRLAASRPMRTYQNSDALLSPDGQALLIRVLGTKPPMDLAYDVTLTDAIRAAAETAAPRGLVVELAGAYPIAALSQRAIRIQAIESIIGSILLLLGLFIVAYRRSFRMFHLAFAPVAVGVLWGFGTYGMTLKSLSPIAAVIGGVLAGMGIDYSVLYLTSFHALRGQGRNSTAAAAETLGQIGTALLAAFVTSVAGFLAIGWSSVQALRDFAILGTMGLTGSFLATLFVLPALLVLTEDHTAPTIATTFRFTLGGMIRWTSSHRAALSTAAAVLTIACAAFAVRGPSLFRPNSDLMVMHPRPNAALDAQLEIGRRFGVSAGAMLVELRAADDRQLVKLAYDVQQRLTSPEVRAAGIAQPYGLATWLPNPSVAEARWTARSPSEADRVVKDFRDAVQDSPFDIKAFDGYTSFLHRLMMPAKIPDLATLRSYPGLAGDLLPRDSGGQPEAVTIVWFTGNEEDRQVRDRAVEAIRGALADLSGATLTGLPVLGHDADEAVRVELPKLLEIAAALVAGYLLVHFRNLRRMLLSLGPAVFGLAVLAGVARWMDIRLNLVNLVALPLLFGIDVDYGIYLVSLASRGGSPREKRSALEGGAHAVMVCASSMTCGYASLMLTTVPAIQSLGFIVAVGVASCLAGALFVLCPVLAENEPGC
jgi:uncharacterized protein